MDHDRLFKELLGSFFAEFLQLFFPDLAAALDPDTAIVPLDKEVFTDVTLGETHEVDLLMRARLRDTDAFFLVHVENQSTPQPDFPRRMFRYFARLTEKYDLPVYPVVVFSYDAPRRPEPDRFVVSFSGETVLQFRYRVIQLNRLPWRRFVRRANPVAAALMAKMRMAPRDRPRVKLECLRLLASLKLDPARSRLIGGFIDGYLRLSAQEMTRYERALAQFAPQERKAAMELTHIWEAEATAMGRLAGKETLVARQLRRRVGAVPADVTARLDRLSADQLDDLGEALLDFTGPADLDRWLAQRQ